MHRKPYQSLSNRQKKRRIIQSRLNENLKDSQVVDYASADYNIPPVYNNAIQNQDYLMQNEQYSDENDSDSINLSTQSQDESDSVQGGDTLEKNNELITVEEKIEAAVINWSVECPNTPKLSITKLLQNLNVFFPHLPKCSSTIIKSHHNVSYTDMHYGRYLHFNNWKECISLHLNKIKFIDQELYININIDGIPLFKDARKFHAYPILLQLCTEPTKIICVGVYLSETIGSNKMPNPNQFLKDFIDGLNQLMMNGITVNKNKCKVCIRAFVCDAPVRAELKNIVKYNSYNGCERCKQHGTNYGGHVALLSINAPLRTNEDFRNGKDGDHVNSDNQSILLDLNINIITCFALDYMHLACLGVMKRLLGRLKSSTRKLKKKHLTPEKLFMLDEKILSACSHIPSDFSRRLSGALKSLSYWKATEFRLFLLYVGIVVFKDILAEDQYINFLYLSIGMRLLLSPHQEKNIENARNLLKNFVTTSIQIYGKEFVSYNVHSIIHLPDDYTNWGSLDNVSCFVFENYLGSVVKGRLNGKNKVLEQISRHISLENEKNCKDRKIDKIEKNKIYFKNSFCKMGNPGDRDSCILTNSEQIGIVKHLSNNSIILDCFEQNESYFKKPVDSKLLGIFKVKGKLIRISIATEDINSKVVLIPEDGHYVAIPLLHQL